jgi:hypothetical protein
VTVSGWVDSLLVLVLTWASSVGLTVVARDLSLVTSLVWMTGAGLASSLSEALVLTWVSDSGFAEVGELFAGISSSWLSLDSAGVGAVFWFSNGSGVGLGFSVGTLGDGAVGLVSNGSDVVLCVSVGTLGDGAVGTLGDGAGVIASCVGVGGVMGGSSLGTLRISVG